MSSFHRDYADRSWIHEQETLEASATNKARQVTAEKLEQCKASMGEEYRFHPSNRLKRITKDKTIRRLPFFLKTQAS